MVADTSCVLVSDGEQRAALAAVRSLGAAGFRVEVTAGTPRSLAAASRFTRCVHIVPDALTDRRATAEAIEQLAIDRDAALVIPVGEATALALLEYGSDALLRRVPMPPLRQFQSVCDKARLLDVARDLGMSVPVQVVAESPAEARAAMASLRWPIVLKPARSVSESGGQRMKLTVRHAASAHECAAHLEQLPAAAYPLLMQERVQGPGLGVFLLRWNGATVASFGHRRIREKPPTGGVSTYRESVALPPDVLAHCEALLAAHEWQGVAMVEFKVDERTGRYVLMEVNGRFWGSLQLAVDAGVNFPVLLAQLALGGETGPPPIPRLGVRLRWEWGEIDHLVGVARLSPVARRASGLPANWFGSLADVLGSWRISEHLEILRASDPRPFARESWSWFRSAIGA